MTKSASAPPIPPAIHLVTVNLNNAAGLRRTIESIEGQTYGNWHHVVQDGGSSDDSISVCSEYWNLRRNVVSESDGGIYDAMNRGLARVSGGLVWFLNSGDTLATPDTLQLVADTWISSGWAWAVGGIQIDQVDDQPPVFFFDPSASARRVLRGYTMFPHPSTVYRAEFIRSLGGFSTDIGAAADQDLAVRAYGVSTPFAINKILSRFEAGGVSDVDVMSHQQRLRRLRAKNHAYVLGCSLVDGVWTYLRVVRLAAKQRGE